MCYIFFTLTVLWCAFDSSGCGNLISRTDNKYCDSSLPRATENSYSQRKWNRFIKKNVDLHDFKKCKQRISSLLSDHKVNWQRGVTSDITSKLSLDLRSLSGMSNAVLTLYSLGHPLHEGPLYYPYFNTETREAIEKTRSLKDYHYAWDYALIDSAFEERSAILWKPLYRVVDTHTDLRVGDPLRFNQFTSTSLHKRVALRFLQPSGTFFTIYGARALPMRDVSQFSQEDEYLLNPFQKFKVHGVTRKNINGTIFNEVLLVPL